MTTTEPKWLTLAREEIGTLEIPGHPSNPNVVNYYLDVVGKRMTDSVPWCAAFVGAMLVRAGEKSSGSLMARSYLSYGDRSGAKPGAIAVFPRGRPPFGHVAFVESVSGNYVVCIGGNQGDAVTRRSFLRKSALGFRWPSTVIQRSFK
jgi:uncharacterized protein (TIGR02594 family)